MTVFGTRSTARPTVLLGAVAGLLAVALAITWGVRLSADDTPSLGDQVAAVANTPQAVAEQATLAFLDVDYRAMAPRIDRVVELATGRFLAEYQAARESLIAGAEEGQAVSTGTVTSVGLSAFSGDTAQVLVAADSTVSNTLIEEARAKGKTVEDTRSYRVQVDLVLVEDRWRVSDLRFVS